MTDTTTLPDDATLPGDVIPIGFRRAEIRRRNERWAERAASKRNEATRYAARGLEDLAAQSLRESRDCETQIAEVP